MENTITIQKEKTRVYFFDELRGLMLLSMILYHAVYDLVVLFRISIPWFFTLGSDIWQATICIPFIFVAGVCCWYSKNNLKRGIRLFLLACAFSLITWLVMPDMIILFGLLHFLGISVLLFPLLRRFLLRIPAVGGAIAGILLFWLTYHASEGWIGLTPSLSFSLPDWLFQVNFLFPLGFFGPDFYSSDYFPMIPYFFLFCSGALLGRLSPPEWMCKSRCKPLAVVGKYSLWIYLVHQPIIAGCLWLVFHFIPQ